MDCFAEAQGAVLGAVGAKRIGTPVSVRIVAHTAPDGGRIEPLLGRALELASTWLDAQPRRLAALGDLRDQVAVSLQFQKGQTALVCVGPQGHSRPLLEIVVTGTSGVLSWEPDSQPAGEVDVPEATGSPLAGRMLEAVRRSLASAEPVTLVPGLPQSGKPPTEASRQSEILKEPQLRPQSAELPYGVLLVAGGRTHQENYAEAFAADSRCRLVGVSDEPAAAADRKRLNEKLARQLGIPLLPDLDEALARKDVHIASVCAEPERRAGIIIRCAEAGKHLYLDKPITASAAEADRVVAAVRAAGVVSQMFSLVRTSAAARLRRLVDSGRLGQVTSVHLDLSFAKGPAGTVSIERPRAESSRPECFELVDSKRELYNVGVYPLVLLHWLLGRPVRRVWATTANYFFAQHRQNDMEDYAVVLLELDGGVCASLAVGRTGWRSHPMGGLNRVCIAGSKGAASIDAYRPRLEVWGDETPWLPPRQDPRDPMGFWASTLREAKAVPKQSWLLPPQPGKSDVAYFLDCIQRGRHSDVSAQVGAAVLKTLMAAYQSAANGRFVAPEA